MTPAPDHFVRMKQAADELERMAFFVTEGLEDSYLKKPEKAAILAAYIQSQLALAQYERLPPLPVA